MKNLFGDVLDDIATEPMGKRLHLTEALMRRMHEKGATIEQLCDRRIMKRSRRTLEMYARKFDLAFPDYVPKRLRPKKNAVSPATIRT